jgi:hypothetical protein
MAKAAWSDIAKGFSVLMDGGGSVADHRARVVELLRARRGELVAAIFARVRDDAFGLVGAQDAEYVAGLRTAVMAAVEYGLQGMERGEGRAGPVPDAVLEQARRAARIGVSLDTVLRRYVVGHTLLEQYVMEEADGDGENWILPTQRSAMRDALRAQASVLDRLLAAITGAYADELARTRDSASALPAMLSNPNARRARECLCFLASHPGSSNRELATGIGVPHQPQISRLLSQLATESLVVKRSQGVGKRNAWQLTSRGEAMLRILTERRG